jgi:hypothetical protein
MFSKLTNNQKGKKFQKVPEIIKSVTHEFNTQKEELTDVLQQELCSVSRRQL